jgi:hypothetical protein
MAKSSWYTTGWPLSAARGGVRGGGERCDVDAALPQRRTKPSARRDSTRLAHADKDQPHVLD